MQTNAATPGPAPFPRRYLTTGLTEHEAEVRATPTCTDSPTGREGDGGRGRRRLTQPGPRVFTEKLHGAGGTSRPAPAPRRGDGQTGRVAGGGPVAAAPSAATEPGPGHRQTRLRHLLQQ